MTTNQDTLSSFLPGFLLRHLEAERALPAEPVEIQRVGAVLFADVSDFTAITEELAGRGPEGAEAVTRLLNRVFGRLLDVIAEHCGDVASFSGDSITAVWLNESADDLRQSVLLASACGLELQRAAKTLVEPEDPPVSVAVSIGGGQAFVLEVGGFKSQWKWVVSGPAFWQVGAAHKVALPGTVVLSPEAHEIAGPAVRGEAHADGTCFITGVDPPSPGGPLSRPRLGTEMAHLMRSYVPQPALERIESGHTGWVSELRRITAVFVNLLELDMADPRDRRRLHAAVLSAQEILDHYEGTLNKLQADDKGFAVVAAFGLPPFAHEEDAARAAQASVEIHAKLKELHVESGIGVATGRAFCGVYGSDVHRQYTMIGSVVNLAARLMQAGRNDVLCDKATAQAGRRRIHFSSLGTLNLKGFATPIAAYRPLWEVGATERQLAILRDQVRNLVVGRDSERRTLKAQLGGLAHGRSSVVVIEGEAGIGKSILAAELVAAAATQGLTALVGSGDAVERNAPYHGWRGIFEQLLDLWRVVDKTEKREMVIERLQAWPRLAGLAPLLNSVLDLEFPENQTTRDMTGQMRRDSTSELLVTLLESAAADSPLVVLIDDAHWLDSASWELVRVVVRKVGPLMMVIASRPLEDQPEPLAQLLSSSTTFHLQLESMEPDLAVQLACNKLGVEHLPEPVADLIKARAGGHPFFSEELAYALRDSGVIRVVDGQCHLVVGPEELLRLDIPDTIHGVVTTRLDQLHPEEAWTVEIASVLGRTFRVDVLRTVHPARLNAGTLRAQLEKLDRVGLITHEDGDTFSFKHTITQEAAYQLLSFDNRRDIHRHVARWYEERSGEVGAAAYALLAHHWEGAADPHKTLQYLEAAGGSALDGGADTEAVYFYRRVIDLDLQHGELFAQVSTRRRAHWHTQLGTAQAQLGDLDGAERAYYSALALLDQRVPSGNAGRSLRLVWEVLRQVGHLIRGSGERRDRGERSEALAQAARICSLIGEVYYFKSDLLGFPLLNLISINVAERSGRSGSAGLGYSSFSYLVGIMRLHRLAARYNDRAQGAEIEAARAPAQPADPWIVPLGPGHKVAAANSRAAYLLSVNRWEHVLPTLNDGIESCRRLRDQYTLAIGLTLRGIAHSFVSPVSEVLNDVAELLASARERSNPQHEAWALTIGTPALLAQDRVEEAISWVEAGQRVMPEADPLTGPIFAATRAQALLRAERRGEALAAAEKALITFRLAPIFPNLIGFRAMLETFLTMWGGAARSDPAQVGELAADTRRALRKLRLFALVFPFARPSLALYRGWAQSLRGRERAARRIWRPGLRKAMRAGLVWDEARLHHRLGRAAPAAGAERAEHLVAARDLFKQLGAEHELGLIASLDNLADS